LQLYAEKDRNGVPVIRKEQERRSGAFRLETNPTNGGMLMTSQRRRAQADAAAARRIVCVVS